MSKKEVKSLPKILVILGPTATGKSDLAVELAKKYDGEVISADSRQVYKGLNIGSGKITEKEMNYVPHHLLDVVSPKTNFSVAQFTKKAHTVIADILARGKLPIIAGGTGFYIDTVINGAALPQVKPNKTLRIKLAKKDAERLFVMLKKIDPKRARIIDSHNKVRIIRSIEIAKTIGKVPQVKQEEKYDTLKIGLNWPEEILKDRIYTRLEKRMKTGMIAEAKHLHEKENLSWKRMIALGLEYKFLALFLTNKISKEEMFTQLKAAIWQYSRRQMTWWKRDKEINWFDLNKSYKRELNKKVSTWLRN